MRRSDRAPPFHPHVSTLRMQYFVKFLLCQPLCRRIFNIIQNLRNPQDYLAGKFFQLGDWQAHFGLFHKYWYRKWIIGNNRSLKCAFYLIYYSKNLPFLNLSDINKPISSILLLMKIWIVTLFGRHILR